MALRNYYLGCPGWGTKTWAGRLFPPGTKPTDFLALYARVFNTVEGNTTFYALPAPDVVLRWRDSVPDEFRFCFKFPKAITHDKVLVDAGAELAQFFGCLRPLERLLGTLWLQLPPNFDGAMLDRLEAFLDRLPTEHRYAVEYRYAIDEAALALLERRGIDFVIMDARGLHASKEVAFVDVRAKKPDLPLVVRATASHPMIRCVPHDQFALTEPFLAPWPPKLATWIAEGRTPYFFMHAPDDTFAPEHAYAFHQRLAALADVGELPPWPAHEPKGQLRLL